MSWAEDMREQLRRIAKADREARIVSWIIDILASPVPVYRTIKECGRVALAKLGHDPHGMTLRDRPWRDVIRLTWRAHRDFYK